MPVNPISGREEQVPYSSIGPLAEAGFRQARRTDMRESAHYPFTSLTSKEAVIEIHGVRGVSTDVTVAARTGWDGNPDQVFVVRNRNYAANAASVGAIRAAMIQCQNRAGGIVHWMRGLDIEIDNRGNVTDAEKGLRIGVRNNTAFVTGDVVGLEIEMLGQAAAGGDDVAIDLVHNDDSNVTAPIGINYRGGTGDGFAFLLRVEANGLDAAGAASVASAVLSIVDDGQNADLASATATINGVLKVVIGSTVGYIATYASYTPT